MSDKSTGVIASVADRRRESFDDPTRGNASWFTLFSSDITPTTDMSAGVMEILSNGDTLEPHRHRQSEIYFVIEGTGILTIDGTQAVIGAGAAVFIPGDAEHSVQSNSDVPLRIFYVFPTHCFADVVYRFSGSAT